MGQILRCFLFISAGIFTYCAQCSAGEDIICTMGVSDSTSMSQTALDSLVLTPTVVPSTDLKWYTMFQRIPGDWVTYANVTFREEHVPQMLGMAAVTAFAIWTDQPVWEASDRWYKGSNTVRHVSDFFEYLGDGKPQFGLAAAFGTFGFITKDERALRTGSQLVETILACGTVVQTLKHITGRESPFVSTRVNGRWVFFPNQIESVT